ncbi:MAG: hypothetical protein COA88_15765 [Kordia sp.]|nr:MAG: hypothetical protein COA88_15765 [Kordia sp.]
MLQDLLNIFKKRQYATESQRDLFERDLNKEVDDKIRELKKESDKKDKIIDSLLLELILMEKGVSLSN